MNNSTKKKFEHFLPWICLGISYLCVILFMIRYSSAYLDSDRAADMILADLTNHEGGILSKNWYYSTCIKVLDEYLLYKIGLLLFPHNWGVARIFGHSILLLLLAVSFVYAGSAVGKKNASVYFSSILLLPMSFWETFHGTIDGTYYCYMTLTAFALGLILRLAFPRKALSNIHKLILSTLLALLSFLIGLGGVRLIMDLYAPLAIAVILFSLIRFTQSGKLLAAFAEKKQALIYSCIGIVPALMGYWINTKILVNRYHFANYENMAWRRLDLSEIMTKASGFLTMFGYIPDDVLGTQSALFSIEGIACAASFLLITAVIAALVRVTKRYSKLSPARQLTVLLFWVDFGLNLLVFSQTNAGYNASYWLPLLPIALLVIQTEAETEVFAYAAVKKLVVSVLTACLILCGYGNAVHYAVTAPRAVPNERAVVQWLVDNGYEKGYASFWHSNVAVEWSNGALDMYTVSDLNTMQIMEWLQKTSHSVPIEGRCFLLVGPGELTEELAAIWEEYTLLYSDDNGYYIFLLQA